MRAVFKQELVRPRVMAIEAIDNGYLVSFRTKAHGDPKDTEENGWRYNREYRYTFDTMDAAAEFVRVNVRRAHG